MPRSVALRIGVVLLAGSALLPGEVRPDESPSRMQGIGVCLKVLSDPARLEARIGRTTTELVGLAEAQWIEHRATTVSEIETGARIHVLARRQTSQRTPEGTRVPPMIVQVGAVVVGDFSPPPLTEEQRNARLEWVSGPLGRIDRNELTIDNVIVQLGPERAALRMVPHRLPAVLEGDPPLLRKGSNLRVEGEVIPPPGDAPPAEKGNRKAPPPRVRVARVEILAPRFPKVDYETILGPPPEAPAKER